MKQAVILVGGMGTRLGGLADGRPKPFVDIAGEPFITRLVRHAKAQGLTRILLLAGHAADWIEQHYKPDIAGIDIQLVREPAPMGTGGALKFAEAFLDDRFMLMNGDSILNGNWTALVPGLVDDVAIAMALRHVPDVGRYGSVRRDGNRVVAFEEKRPGKAGAGWINAGVYAMRRDAVLPLIERACSLEVDIFPKLVATGQLAAVEMQGYFIDIGIPDTLSEARQSLDQHLRRPAVIFDRDNTLVQDEGYTHKPDDLRWTPDAVAAIRALNDAGYGVFVATNQAGIAKGKYREEHMHAFHAEMQRQLQRAGAHIDGFYFCPHHVEGVVPELAVRCSCRKPEPGMLEAIAADHDFRREAALVVGDKISDIEAAHAFGIRGALYEEGSMIEFLRAQGVKI